MEGGRARNPKFSREARREAFALEKEEREQKFIAKKAALFAKGKCMYIK